jgi:hypothetical protein
VTGIEPAYVAANITDLRGFAAEVRMVAGRREPDRTPLAAALHVVADAAEAVADRLVNGDDPTSYTEDDMMVIMMLAGYMSGQGGITQARELINHLITENEGATQGGDDV